MTRKNNLKGINWLVSLAALMAVAVMVPSPVAQAAPGDVSFMIEDQNIFTIPSGFSGGDGTNSSLDVFLQIEDGGNVNAGAFALSLNVTGLVTFNVGPVTTDPNLSATSQNSFVFDTESLTGVAYGNNPAGPSSLGAVGIATGNSLNLSVPDGAGLFAAPINIPDGTSGPQTVSFGSNPSADSLVFVGNDDSGDAFLPIGTSNDATLTIVPTSPGDSDLSGVVDLADLGDWLNNVGSTSATWQQGNWTTNLDSIVDLDDLVIWLNNVGTDVTPSPVAASASVPEPSTLIMLLLVTPLALRRRHRRRN